MSAHRVEGPDKLQGLSGLLQACKPASLPSAVLCPKPLSSPAWTARSTVEVSEQQAGSYMHAQTCDWVVRRSLCVKWCTAVPVQDTDGTAYIIFSSEDNKVMHIHRLGTVSHCCVAYAVYLQAVYVNRCSCLVSCLCKQSYTSVRLHQALQAAPLVGVEPRANTNQFAWPSQHAETSATSGLASLTAC